jgi:hypothetical protein
MFPVLEVLARPLLLVTAVTSVFVAGVVLVQPGRMRVRTAIALALVPIVLTTIALALPSESFWYLFAVGVVLANIACLIAFCIYCVLRYVMQANRITRDQIHAGISVYLMLGFAFGCVYYLLCILDPSCFSVSTAGREGSRAPDLMYFSFITLTTLGYGDITPVAKMARALVEVEAVGGSLYMAVFMARLVSMAGGEDWNRADRILTGSTQEAEICERSEELRR